ncbi:MAG: HDOD domain-containing protein, partial [Leptospira sp.]|nr:HDOD domain-containing protein [Leptospira sp.]
MKDKVDSILNDINKLPSVSGVVIKIMEMARNPSVSIQDLSAEISKDPSITAAIIKLSNSAYYRASKPIKTVQESLMTLGIRTVKEIILVTAAKGILNKDVQGYQIDADSMWLHSLVVAELSSKIAEKKKLPVEKDLVFTAGLLNDIGKLVLA